MRREESPSIEAAGQDSFLDVTTNIVGILIILVMVVGMRAKNLPSSKAQERDQATAKVAALEKQSATVEYDVRRVQEQLETVESESAARAEERELLATLMVAAEKELASRRSQLDAAAQEEFDLRRQLDESKRNLERGQSELADLDAQKPPTKQVNHYPTPISRKVLGDEIHFQLKDGRLAFVPIEEFVDEIRRTTRNIYDTAKHAGVVGPRYGFEMRYRLEPNFDRMGMFVGAGAAFEIVPIGLQQGETVDQALSPRSEFRALLARNSPPDTAVTLWTYPNSFADYRRVKEELYRMGFATAGRLLPEGELIRGGSGGTRSSAQ